MRVVAKKKILLPGFALLCAYLVAFTVLFIDYNSKKDLLREDLIGRLASSYSAVTGVYEKVTEQAFRNTVRNPDFLELYSTAIFATHPGEKTFWRAVFGDRLKSSFEKLAYYHIRTLNLIEPDGTIFLRMDKRSLYGDNILSHSPLQAIALRERRIVHGFQLGRTENLYRYSFPIFWRNTFIGSAEFGVSALAITEQLKTEFPGNYTLLLRKDLVEPLLVPSMKDRYEQSAFSDLYIENQSVRDEPLPTSELDQEKQRQITEQVLPAARESLASGKSFLVSGRAGSLPFSVIFLQVKAPGGPPVGYIVVSLKDNRFENLRHLYTVFAAMVSGLFLLACALLLQWLRYHERLVNEALYDSLTGGLKQGQFDSIATRESSISKRYRQPLSLVLFDLDHFKTVNDRLGHLEGDAVLTETGKAVRKAVRVADYFFRWGGDEFLLILPGTDLSGARSMAEKVRVLIENLRHEEVNSLSISAGVAQLEEADINLREVLQRADEALYRAKANGRNRVSI